MTEVAYSASEGEDGQIDVRSSWYVMSPNGWWDMIEPSSLSYRHRSPSRKAVGRVYPIEPASGAFCLSFAVEFLGRCCRRSWAAARA